MSKTIRRKGLKNVHGLYEWRNEVRNRENASDVYFHSDMMSRKGGSYDFTSQPCREIKKATKRLTRTQISQLSIVALYFYPADAGWMESVSYRCAVALGGGGFRTAPYTFYSALQAD